MDGGSSLDSGHASRRAAEAGQFGSAEQEVLLSSSLAVSGLASRSSGRHLDAGEMNCGPGLPGEGVQRWDFKCVAFSMNMECDAVVAGWKFEQRNSNCQKDQIKKLGPRENSN